MQKDATGLNETIKLNKNQTKQNLKQNITEHTNMSTDQFFTEGVPHMMKMSFNCSVSCDEGNSGLPVAISARMQPTDHMSTEVP